ncbi:MAG TPA: hypothetical protein VN698_16400 [Bacteroidia bacterium]|nr:hypothetical protein [Bacteroidia bacterium]
MKIIIADDLALCQYEPNENPEFDFDSKTGVLFVFGYNVNFGDNLIGAAQRCETGLIGYKQLTGSAFTAAYDRVCRLAYQAGVNIDNCVAFFKS